MQGSWQEISTTSWHVRKPDIINLHVRPAIFVTCQTVPSVPSVSMRMNIAASSPATVISSSSGAQKTAHHHAKKPGGRRLGLTSRFLSNLRVWGAQVHRHQKSGRMHMHPRRWR
eukprot:350048-Chlamydomonas_euryale.AAC.12